MTQDDILAQFRSKAREMEQGQLDLRDLVMELAQLLADSRGRLSKENFETLVHVGAALYKEGLSRFQARTDVDEIMERSSRRPEHDGHE